MDCTDRPFARVVHVGMDPIVVLQEIGLCGEFLQTSHEIAFKGFVSAVEVLEMLRQLLARLKRLFAVNVLTNKAFGV